MGHLEAIVRADPKTTAAQAEPVGGRILRPRTATGSASSHSRPAGLSHRHVQIRNGSCGREPYLGAHPPAFGSTKPGCSSEFMAAALAHECLPSDGVLIAACSGQ